MTPSKAECDEIVQQVREARRTCPALRRVCALLVTANLDEHADEELMPSDEWEKLQAAKLLLWHVAVAHAAEVEEA